MEFDLFFGELTYRLTNASHHQQQKSFTKRMKQSQTRKEKSREQWLKHLFNGLSTGITESLKIDSASTLSP